MRKLPPIDRVTRDAILEGLAQAERGEFVPDEIVANSDRRHGIGFSTERIAEVERHLAAREAKT